MSKKRNKAMCHSTKQRLIEEYGTICMLCHKNFGKAITHHHIHPVYAGGGDNYDNGSLLCMRCQSVIHHYDYGTQDYTELTNKIKEYMRENSPLN